MPMRINARPLLLALALACACAEPLRAQDAAGTDLPGADVIVVLDTSQSVLPWFKEATDYAVGPVVRDFLRLGDTFHLLSFGSSVQVEIAQRVESEADLRSILGRLWLLYPVARSTDLLGALSYLGQYLADLPVSIPKYVVFITDGVNDPETGSVGFGLSPEESTRAFGVEADRIRRNGWRVRIVQLPFSADRAAAEAASAGRLAPAATASGPGNAASAAPTSGSSPGSLLADLGEALGTEVTPYSEADRDNLARKSLALPVAIFPADIGKHGHEFDLPLVFRNPTGEEVQLELEAALVDGTDTLREKAFVRLAPGAEASLAAPLSLPASMEPGAYTLSIELRFADGMRTAPSRGQVRLTLAPNPLALLFRSAGKAIMAIIVLAFLLAAVLLVLFLVRRAPRHAAAPVVRAVRDHASTGKGRPDRGAVDPTVVGAVLPAGAAARSAQAAPYAGSHILSVDRPGSPSVVQPRIHPETDLPHAGSVVQPAVAMHRGHSSGMRSPPFARPGSVTLEFRVDEQNPHVGRRNIHTLPAGSLKTIGGGRSDFLIFLVPMPPRCAELQYDGERIFLVPLRSELFPGLGGPREMGPGDCVAMLSPKGYPLRIGFHPYESPTDRINRLLHCIETPGLFSFDLDS